MDVDALRYFLAVVEARSMRGASEDLHIAQSALSRQITGLEKELGVSLLMRLPRGVKPTEAGVILARRARSILDQFASARDELGALRGLDVGKVTISAIEPVADGLLMACIRRMQKDHPGIAFDIRVGNSSKVIGLLREGIVELAIAYNAPHDRDLVIRTESPVPLVALVSDGHELAGKETCKLAEILDRPLVLPPAGSPSRFLIDEAIRRSGAPAPRVALESDSVPVRLAFLKGSKSVAIMANISGRMAQSGNRICAVKIADPLLTTGALQLLGQRDHQLSQAAAAFERLLRTHMRQLASKPTP
jgi:DNA-binding transcriptional LysR family regulator